MVRLLKTKLTILTSPTSTLTPELTNFKLKGVFPGWLIPYGYSGAVYYPDMMKQLVELNQ